MPARTWSKYYTDQTEALAAASVAKEEDGLSIAVLGPVKTIKRPKAGGGNDTWANPEGKDHWVVVATDAELTKL